MSTRVVEDRHGEGHQGRRRKWVGGRVPEGPVHPSVAQSHCALGVGAAESIDVGRDRVHRPELREDLAG